MWTDDNMVLNVSFHTSSLQRMHSFISSKHSVFARSTLVMSRLHTKGYANGEHIFIHTLIII